MPSPVLTGETVRGFQATGMNLADGIISTYDETIKRAAKAAGLREEEYQAVQAENLYS